MQYVTVSDSSESEIIIERSRFLTLVAPCANEEEARALLSKRKKQHFSANHNCYAFIAEGGQIAKFSDDGEPGGTAGAPIMEALKKSGVINAIVIVTRYFGGIKLGAGGLTRAYIRSAAEGLKAAKKATFYLTDKIRFSLSYEDYQTFLRFSFDGAKVASVDFSDSVTVTMNVKSEAITSFNDSFTQTFLGKYAYEFIQKEYVELD